MYNISLDLSILEDYSITKFSIKIRISLDVFKSLEKEILFDFDSGEELVVQLEYENLDCHCSECNSLLHGSIQWPLCSSQSTLAATIAQPTHSRSRAVSTREQEHTHVSKERVSSYSQRVNRHGIPFAEKLPLLNRGAPLRNKLTSNSNMVFAAAGANRYESRCRPSRSPPRSRPRRHHDARFSPVVITVKLNIFKSLIAFKSFTNSDFIKKNISIINYMYKN